MAHPDLGVFDAASAVGGGAADGEENNNGGNLEVSPPVPENAPEIKRDAGGPKVKAHRRAPFGEIILGSDNRPVEDRQAAATGLDQRGGPDTPDSARAALPDTEDQLIKLTLISILGRLGHLDDRTLLRQYAEDSDPEVAQAAKNAMDDIGRRKPKQEKRAGHPHEAPLASWEALCHDPPEWRYTARLVAHKGRRYISQEAFPLRVLVASERAGLPVVGRRRGRLHVSRGRPSIARSSGPPASIRGAVCAGAARIRKPEPPDCLSPSTRKAVSYATVPIQS